MPELQGLVSFPNINQIISFEYTLTHGITAGQARITIAPQKDFTGIDGDITITFGDMEPIIIPDCRLNTHSFEFNEGGYIWRLSILDKRWRWKYGDVTGNYNLRWRKIGQWNDTLDLSTEVSPVDLCKKCLVAMFEDDYDLSGIADNLQRPETHWDHSNPAQALADLADKMGCRVVMKIDGSVAVVKTGEGEDLPRDQDVKQESLSINPPLMPDLIRVVCGPTRYQGDFLLEPCGLDIDGKVKAINDLSYKPAEGWGASLGSFPQGGFYGVPKGMARTLAQATVFRWYRIPPVPVGLNGEPLSLPGLDDPAVIKTREQILPIEDEQVETFLDTDPIMKVQPVGAAVPVNTPVPKNKPALVWGFHGANDLSFSITPNITKKAPNCLVPAAANANAAYAVGDYQIDRANGIVKFHKPQFMFTAGIPKGFQFTPIPGAAVGGGAAAAAVVALANAAQRTAKTVGALAFNDFIKNPASPAIIALRCACNVWDPSGKVPKRHVQDLVLVPFGSKPPSRSTGPRILRHQEIQLNFFARRNDGWLQLGQLVNAALAAGVAGPGAALGLAGDGQAVDIVADNAVQQVISNLKTGILAGAPGVEPQCDYYLKAALQEYQRPTPYEILYAGIKAIDVDGAVQCVHWTISRSGAFTRASYNSEMRIPAMSYDEKRFLEKFWNDPVGQVQAAIANPIQNIPLFNK